MVGPSLEDGATPPLPGETRVLDSTPAEWTWLGGLDRGTRWRAVKSTESNEKAHRSSAWARCASGMSRLVKMAHIWDRVSHFHSRFDLLHLVTVGGPLANLP
jgi:hypothetical protein